MHQQATIIFPSETRVIVKEESMDRPELQIHSFENNFESQVNLKENRDHFSEKCRQLLVRLCNGERLLFADCVRNIGDLRRRSKDLRDVNGIDVQRTFRPLTEEEKLRKAIPVKEYWLKPEEIERCKLKYSELLKQNKAA